MLRVTPCHSGQSNDDLRLDAAELVLRFAVACPQGLKPNSPPQLIFMGRGLERGQPILALCASTTSPFKTLCLSMGH